MPFKGIPFYIMNQAKAATETVVSSGLQLYFDAGLSTSYPGSGTTWNDISGNSKTATIYGNFSFVSSGSASYLTDFWNFSTYATINSTSYTNLTAITMQVIFRYTNGENPYDGAKFIAAFSGGNDFGIETGSGYNLNFSSDGGGRRSPTIYAAPDQWHFFSAVRDTSTLSISGCIDGGSRSTNTYASLSTLSWTGGWMLNRSNTGAGVTLRGARVGAILYYNRALTTTEEIQNYNYFKTRYAIP